LFADPERPDRMTAARDYVRQLDALPITVQADKFLGHCFLAETNYLAGDGSGVVAEVLRAYALASEIPFAERAGAATGRSVLTYAQVESGRPGGRERIQALVQRVFQLSVPPVGFLQGLDSTQYRKLGQFWHDDFQAQMALISYVGQPALPIVATHWYNTTTR